MNLGTCRSCGAAIVWVKTAWGKSMPLDAAPVPDGNLIIVDGVGVSASAETLPVGIYPLYKSHFATCPNAAQHRKEKP